MYAVADVRKISYIFVLQILLQYGPDLHSTHGGIMGVYYLSFLLTWNMYIGGKCICARNIILVCLARSHDHLFLKQSSHAMVIYYRIHQKQMYTCTLVSNNRGNHKTTHEIK